MCDEMRSNRWPEMIYVYLDATCPQGHHGKFVDSVNNGPWESALVQEFIPYLEQTFRMTGTPATRFLTGHSSGGWSALWLQLTQPEFFGGVWATFCRRPGRFPELAGTEPDAPAAGQFLFQGRWRAALADAGRQP